MKLLILTASLVAATPALAAPANTVPTANASTGAIKDDRKRYCFVDDLTGSRLPIKTCKSRAEWSAFGVDVTRKAAR